jgi:Arc/MetJ-type ribon-helix-helix transcriptional regulator
MPQLVTRLDADLLEQVDNLIAAGSIENRSEAVRSALTLWVHQMRRDNLDRTTVAAYLKQPQTPEEVDWTDAAARQLIEEEPW